MAVAKLDTSFPLLDNKSLYDELVRSIPATEKSTVLNELDSDVTASRTEKLKDLACPKEAPKAYSPSFYKPSSPSSSNPIENLNIKIFHSEVDLISSSLMEDDNWQESPDFIDLTVSDGTSKTVRGDEAHRNDLSFIMH